MKFYTDGSRVGKVDNFFIGWSAVCKNGVIINDSRKGGSNINAEIFAIRDLLSYISNKLNNKRIKIENIIDDGSNNITIVTDSKTSIQIIQGFLKDSNSYNVNESENYLAASKIKEYIETLKNFGISVDFKHIRGHGKDPSMDEVDILGNSFADHIATKMSEELKSRYEETLISL